MLLLIGVSFKYSNPCKILLDGDFIFNYELKALFDFLLEFFLKSFPN